MVVEKGDVVREDDGTEVAAAEFGFFKILIMFMVFVAVRMTGKVLQNYLIDIKVGERRVKLAETMAEMLKVLAGKIV